MTNSIKLAGFRWIIPGQLAGSARPGLLRDLSADLTFLSEQGITRIVNLTTKALPASVADAGFEVIHFAIADMGIPTPRACAALCAALVVDLPRSPTLLHCRGGLGRTGTMAACVLVSLGQGSEQALSSVRAINGNYVQSAAQTGFITHYADWLRSAEA